MTSSSPTITDLVRLLMSRGLSPEMSLGTADEIDRMFEISTRFSAAAVDQRKKWREKKQRQRARRANVPGGQDADLLNKKEPIKIQDSKKKERKNPAMSPHVPGDVSGGQDDGWPEDYAERFWTEFPPYRRQAKVKVVAKLAKLRAAKTVEWPVLIEAVQRFAATNPGEYAPAPMVWLNDGRWDREYGNGGSNGKAQGYPTRTGFAGLAARLRHGAAAVQPDAGNATADQQSPHGR